MSGYLEDRACPARSSARRERLQNGNGTATIVDVVLAAVAVLAGLAIIADPAAGPIDGRHVLAGLAFAALTIRTIAAPRG